MKTWTQKSNERGSRFAYRGVKMNLIRWCFFAAVALLVFSFPATTAAQGFYWGSPVSPGYDRTAVVEISGVVLHVDLAPRSGPSTLRIESEGETLTVTLGPEWYLRRLNVDFQVGDKLAIKGSKMKTKDEKIYLTAANIKNLRTGKSFELRDESGRPLWSSKRRSYKERWR